MDDDLENPGYASPRAMPSSRARKPAVQNSSESREKQLQRLGDRLAKLTPQERAQALRIAAKALAIKAKKQTSPKG